MLGELKQSEGIERRWIRYQLLDHCTYSRHVVITESADQ